MRLLSVYVAGASAEIERAEKCIAALRLEGFAVPMDWPATIREVGQANPPDATREKRAFWAWRDLFEASMADIFWLLMPKAPTIGAWVEYGYAQGKGGPLFLVSGEGHERSIFTAGATCFERDEDALAHILTMGKDLSK